MKSLISYWLEWDWDPQKRKILTRINGSRNHELEDYGWSEVGKRYITVFCDSNTFGNISRVAENEGLDIKTDEKKWIHEIGQTRFKLVRGGTEKKREGTGTQAFKLLCELEPNFVKNHPQTEQDFWKISNNWKLAPRFENLTEGVYENVYKVDIKSCYVNIMRDYPLSCGKPELIKDKELIEQKLKEGKEGFVAFFLKNKGRIKNNQIPFISNKKGEIREDIEKGERIWLYTKLLKVFNHQYGKKGKLIYKNFWIFKEKKAV